MAKTKYSFPMLNEGQATARTTGRLWVLTDPATGDIALTNRGLLAVYTSRKQAREAKASGRIRVENARVQRFVA